MATSKRGKPQRRSARNPRPSPKHEPGWRLRAFKRGWSWVGVSHDKAGRWRVWLFAWEHETDTRVQRRKAREAASEAAGKARTQRALDKAKRKAADTQAVDARLAQQRADAARPAAQPLEPTRILRAVPSGGGPVRGGEPAFGDPRPDGHVQAMTDAGLCGHPNATGGYCRNVVRRNPCPAHGTMPRNGGNAS